MLQTPSTTTITTIMRLLPLPPTLPRPSSQRPHNHRKSGMVNAAQGERYEKGACPLPSCVTPKNFFENIRANLCNLVHFWRPVQQKMYTSVFNLNFGEINLMTSGHQKWHGKSTLKSGTWNLPSQPYRFHSPCSTTTNTITTTSTNQFCGRQLCRQHRTFPPQCG